MTPQEHIEVLDLRWQLFKQYEKLGNIMASKAAYEAYRFAAEVARVAGLVIKRDKNGKHRLEAKK